MGHRCECRPRCGCEPIFRPRCGNGFGFGDSWWPLLLLLGIGGRGRRRWF